MSNLLTCVSSTSLASNVSLNIEIRSSSLSCSSSPRRAPAGAPSASVTAEPVPCDLVERVADHADCLRLLRLAAVEVGAAGKLERQHLGLERSRASLAEERRDWNRARLDGGEHGALPRLLELLERERRCLGRSRLVRPAWRHGRRALRSRLRPNAARRNRRRRVLELLDPERERLARQVGAGARHLDQRELERQSCVGSLARVLDATASRSQSRSTVGAGSWFACSRSRSRVSSVTGSESGT